MKNSSLVLAAFLLVMGHISAQKKLVWFDTGIKAQVGASGLLNKNFVDSEEFDYTIGLTSGFGVGGRIGINKDYSGLSLEGMYVKGKQEMKPADGSALSYDWQSIDAYALFRNSKNLGYFEIGPKAQFLSKLNKTVGTTETDITSSFNKMNFAGVIGFGANLIGNDGAFSGLLGLRFEYGFTDIVGKDFRTSATSPIGDPLLDYKSTNPWFAGLVFELNWGIGYFGVAQCGARSKFIMF